MDYKEALNSALEYAVDGELVKFNSVVASILQAKSAEAIDSAKEVVASDMYNFADEEENTEEKEDE